MKTRLQTLVDELAEDLGRTVTIDDEHWHLEACSALVEDPDPLRLEAILKRDVPAPAKQWARELGLAESKRPVRVPRNPTLGADPRVVVPLRRGEALLGFLTLLDRRGNLSDEELATAERAAESAAELMFHDRLVDGAGRARERELVADLLIDDEHLRRHAAGALADEGLLSGAPVWIVVLQCADGRHEHPLESVVERVRRRVRPHSLLALVRGDDAVVLAAGAETSETASRELLGAARDRALDGSVGVSAALDDLADALPALRQAKHAARVAARFPIFDGLGVWDELGVYAMLSALEDAQTPPHPALERLRAADPSGVLVRTLEAYLDRGGDVRATAAALALHRAGLYYRLSRIREITGLGLRDGDVRLGLHLSIKLMRLDRT